MKIYAVVVNRDDTVRVASIDVVKKTTYSSATNAAALVGPDADDDVSI